MKKEDSMSAGAALGREENRILPNLVEEMSSTGVFAGGPNDNSTNLRDHLELYYQHFRQAVELSDPKLFSEFLIWARSVQKSRHSGKSFISELNQAFRRELEEHLTSEYAEEAVEILEDSILLSQNKDTDFFDSYLTEENYLGSLAQNYLHHLLEGKRKKASNLIMDIVANGTPVEDIYLHVFQPCQYEIGRLWQLNELTVAQEHFCTAATQMIMSQLYSHIFSKKRINKTVVAVTLGGQLHEIGIRMVADLFEMEGWDTFYLGANCPEDKVIEELINRDADLLALSVTMASSIEDAKNIIKKVKNYQRLKNCKVIIGGYSFRFSKDLWKSTGADGFAENARKAIEIANEIVRDTN